MYSSYYDRPNGNNYDKINFNYNNIMMQADNGKQWIMLTYTVALQRFSYEPKLASGNTTV